MNEFRLNAPYLYNVQNFLMVIYVVSYLSGAQRLILKVMAEVKSELRELRKMVHQHQGQGRPVTNEEEVGLPEGLLLPPCW